MYFNPIFGMASLSGYFFGRYCDCDWDILGTNQAESRAIHELKILGYLIYGISSIYGAIFMRHHRSFQTHFPWFSTLIRLLFLFWWIPILYWFDYIKFDWWQMWLGLGFWFGLGMSDLPHFLADHIWPEDGKRFIRQEEERKRKLYRR